MAGAQRLHNEAVALARAGHSREASDKLLSAIRTAGEANVDPRTLKALWQIARAEGDWKTALAAGFRAAVRNPQDFPFVDAVVRSLHECPPQALLGDSGFRSRPMAVLPPFLSVVVVSRDDERYAAVDAQYEKTFAAWPHERSQGSLFDVRRLRSRFCQVPGPGRRRYPARRCSGRGILTSTAR